MTKLKRSALALALAAATLLTVPSWAQNPSGYPAAPGTVQTYTDQAVTPPPLPPAVVPYNSPLTAGQMTLQDVLRAHPSKTANPLLSPPTMNPASAVPDPHPQVPTTNPSSANLMLMQGMKSALQQDGTIKPGSNYGAHLTSPQMQQPGAPASAAPQALNAASSGAIAAPVVQSSGVQYQPGQAPVNLATGKPSSGIVSSATAASSGQAVEPVSPVSGAITSSEETVTGPADASGCSPRSASWVKSCADAGYPANYVGQIKGETQTTCPGNVLKDVWMDNNCSPPEATDNGPLTAPTPTVTNSSPESSEISNAMAQQIPATRGDASCGPSNGLAASAKPTSDLCASGQSTEVSGNGPWRWSCNGAKGGMTVSCAAPATTAARVNDSVNTNNSTSTAPTSTALNPDMAASEDGSCGSSAGVGIDHAPAANLCQRGNSSHVSGGGPWTWACSGLNGGQAAACEAPKRSDGVCGSASGMPADQMPMADLCNDGYASAVTGNGPWNWTCSGLNGGSAATCSAAPKTDAVCGPASLSGHQHTPNTDLCSVGHSSPVSGNGPWAWSCDGENGGASVACTAPTSMNGACGAANGGSFTHAPSDNLCMRGAPSRVTGAGPWAWNCEGADGGNTESCTALVKDTRYETMAPDTAAALSSEASSSTTSPGSSGEVETASPSAPAAAPTPVVTKSVKTAKASKSSKTKASAPSTETAVAAVPSITAAEAQPATRDHVSGHLCGQASELMAIEAPDHNLCQSGTAGPISGEGPFDWTCTSDGGETSKCSTLAPAGSLTDIVPTSQAPTSQTPAAVPPPAPIVADSEPQRLTPVPAPVAESHPACGLSAGRSVTQSPVDNLCAVGKATPVHGTGPWRWTCAKGREKVNCEAQITSDGACGSVNGSVQKYAPTSGLCAGGSPTEVQGTGPWLWSCVGSGGGVSASCSAASQSQARVDGTCGAAATTPSPSTPVSNLCDSGVASNVYGDGPWTWTCSGLNGGVANSCSTQKNVPKAPPPPGPSLNGLCGSSNGVAMVVQPMDGLCSTGTPTGISGNGPWNWNCLGDNGGMTVSCTAPLQPPAPITGVCGGASGVSTLTTPRSGLCSAGISSAVSGHGPWTWSCSGTNGGGAVGCVAPLAGAGGTGSLPSLVTPSSMMEAPVPQAAGMQPVTSQPMGSQTYTSPSGMGSGTNSGLVTPRLPTGPLPPLQNGSMPQMIPSGQFPPPPEASAIPPEPAQSEMPEAPTAEPDLPSGTTPLMPPPIRDTIRPSPALRPPGVDANGTVVPGNHFVLDEDVSTVPFSRGSENIDSSGTQTLDKLTSILRTNSGLRVTLTAYADGSGSTPREARRLSLTRALAIRDYLTSKGVASSRVDVRALGTNVQGGDSDRVDIKAN